MMTVPTGTMQKGVKKRVYMVDQVHICLFDFNSLLLTVILITMIRIWHF